MIRRLMDFVGCAVERRLRDIAFGAVAAASVALLFAISLGFGVAAAYGHLRGELGGVVAALIICAVFGLAAIMIAVIWAVRRRKARQTRRAAVPASAGSVASLLQSLTEIGAAPDREIMAAALRLGREISPMRLIALAMVGGFIVGRKRGK